MSKPLTMTQKTYFYKTY